MITPLQTFCSIRLSASESFALVFKGCFSFLTLKTYLTCRQALLSRHPIEVYSRRAWIEPL